jgi:hypothetical protein
LEADTDEKAVPVDPSLPERKTKKKGRIPAPLFLEPKPD